MVLKGSADRTDMARVLILAALLVFAFSPAVEAKTTKAKKTTTSHTTRKVSNSHKPRKFGKANNKNMAKLSKPGKQKKNKVLRKPKGA